ADKHQLGWLIKSLVDALYVLLEKVWLLEKRLVECEPFLSHLASERVYALAVEPIMIIGSLWCRSRRLQVHQRRHRGIRRLRRSGRCFCCFAFGRRRSMTVSSRCRCAVRAP